MTKGSPNRIEWLFPVRGRWLRYLLSGCVLLFFLLWCSFGFTDLPTIANATNGVHVDYPTPWGLGAGGASHNWRYDGELHFAAFGPLRLQWETYDSWANDGLRFIGGAIVVVLAGSTFFGLLFNRGRGTG